MFRFRHEPVKVRGVEIVLLIVLASSIWVAADASGRDWSRSKVARSPVGWFFCSLLLWIVVFPVYLAVRGNHPKRRVPVSAEGWYPNPDGKGRRWWDGRRWTDWTEP